MVGTSAQYGPPFRPSDRCGMWEKSDPLIMPDSEG